MDKKTAEQIFAPNPPTERGYASNFVISQNGEWLGYCIRNTVILRSLKEITVAKVFTKHSHKTTSVCFHPEGKLAASSDEKGNAFIWYIDDCTDKHKLEHVLPGRVRGMAFTEDGTKLLFYGEGKKLLASCVNWETGTSVSDFSNNSRTLLAGDLNTKKPYKAVLGGEDGVVNFYSGVPFKYTTMSKEHSGNFVTGLKFSPDNSKIVSTGFDKKIVIYNGETGEVIEVIAKDKSEGNHKMAIIAVTWLDNDRFITASLDKTVKVWSVTEKKCVITLNPAEKLGVPNMMCGVQTNGKVIVALTLNGIINLWNIDTMTDGKLPDQIIEGHQAPISKLLYIKSQKELVSSDTNGKILVWPEGQVPKLLAQRERKVVTMALSADDTIIYEIDTDGTLTAYERTGAVKFTVPSSGSDPRGLVSSRKGNDTVYILFYDSIVSVLNGKVAKTTKFKYEATALEVNEEAGEILIGDTKGALHILDMNFEEKSKIPDKHTSPISVIKLSPDNKLIATGDTYKMILIWDATTKEITVNSFGAHSAKVLEVDWSKDSSHLVSGSLDGSVMVWKLEDKSRVRNYQNMDNEQINSVIFINESSEFVSGGLSGAIKKVTI